MNRSYLSQFASEDLIDAIKKWASSNENFELDWIESVEAYLDRNDRVSPLQRKGLENIILNYEIEI